MSELVEHKDDQEYKIKASRMSPGQKVECPDKNTDVEKLDQEHVKLSCKKGYCTKTFES